jgi:cytochrome c-type biogenesis protein CcmH/NrfF
MNSPPPPPLSDSPWFWLLAFCLMALLALAAMHGKYTRRQAREERKYQAAERVAAGETASEDGANSGRRPFSTPDQTLIPLWPLAILMLAISLVALVMLRRERRFAKTLGNEAPP